MSALKRTGFMSSVLYRSPYANPRESLHLFDKLSSRAIGNSYKALMGGHFNIDMTTNESPPPKEKKELMSLKAVGFCNHITLSHFKVTSATVVDFPLYYRRSYLAVCGWMAISDHTLVLLCVDKEPVACGRKERNNSPLYRFGQEYGI